MESKTAERIIEKICSRAEPAGKHIVFNSESYRPAEIRPSNFKAIKESRFNGRIAFVDGGNITVVEGADFCLQAARIYHTVYFSNKRVRSGRDEFFAFAGKEKGEISVEIIRAETADGPHENSAKKMSFSLYDPSLATKFSNASPAAAANAARKLAELSHALDVAATLESGDILALDRDLQPSVTGEDELLAKIRAKAAEKGVIVCGISKTSRLCTEEGGSAAEAVRKIEPSGEWHYHPACIPEKENAEIMLAKLHSSSKYIFRIDTFSKSADEIEPMLSALKENSSDPVFFGYPYGMIEADRFARVSNEEAEYMKVRIIAKAGSNSAKIARLMSSVDAHSVLDNIS